VASRHGLQRSDAMKIDKVKAKASELLGGRNVTAKRMEALLEELETLRARTADGPKPSAIDLTEGLRELPSVVIPISGLSTELRKAYDDATRDGDPDDGPDPEPAEPPEREEIAAGAPVPIDPKDRLIQSLEMQNQMMMTMLKNFEAKLDDLTAKRKTSD